MLIKKGVYQESNKDIDSFLEKRLVKLAIVTDTEEKSVSSIAPGNMREA